MKSVEKQHNNWHYITRNEAAGKKRFFLRKKKTVNGK